jgi:DNA polymerase
MKLFIDFESYWATKAKYDLKSISTVEYIRDPRFHAFGLGICGETGEPEWISHNSISAYLTAIAEQVGWPNVEMVSHSVKFDAFILHHVYETIPGSFVCTKSMSRAVLAKSIKNHSLSTLAEHFQLESKGIMKTDGLETLTPEQEEELAIYCKHDVWLCREIYNRLAEDFPISQYTVMDQTIKMFVNPRLVLNVPLLEKAAKEESERRENIFKEIGIEKKEFASNVKFPALLAARGYEVPRKPSPKNRDEEGKAVFIPALALGDPEFLELLESEDENLRRLCEARVAAKSTLLETRSKKLAAIGKTGYWPFDVEFSGADQTHRFSGGSGAGGNGQNFIRDSVLREAVEAPQGYSLIVGDFANIEMRLVAYLSKDPGLIHAIETNLDLYCDFASAFFRRKITGENKAERNYGKCAILGLGYNMGAEKFAKTVKIKTKQAISKEEAWNTVNLYRTRYPLVPALWKKLDDMIPRLQKHGFSICCSRPEQPGRINLPSGLQIQYPSLRSFINKKGKASWQYDAYRKGHLETSELYGGKILENICQALAGELCKGAMLEMGEQVVGQVHDEILVLCKKGTELIAKQKLQRVMSKSPEWFKEIKLAAEVGHGRNWKEAK